MELHHVLYALRATALKFNNIFIASVSGDQSSRKDAQKVFYKYTDEGYSGRHCENSLDQHLRQDEKAKEHGKTLISNSKQTESYPDSYLTNKFFA